MESKKVNKKPFRQVHPLLLALYDVLAIGICLLIFAYFDHVRPRAMQKDTSNQMLASATQIPVVSQMPDVSQPAATPVPDPNDWRVKFADQFVDGDPVITENSYKSRNVSVTLTKTSLPELTFFVQDVYVANIECIRNVFAADQFGVAITEPVLDMANRIGAIGAINGDYYGHGSVGVVIRNGTLYRDSWAPDQDVMVLFRDGTMRAYENQADFNAEAVMAAGAWQAWTFGPSLLTPDGQKKDSYENVSHDPRTVFAMVEPGHYKLITIDGRQGNYSEGMTFAELAQLCLDLGCKAAYNLDGGKTSQMTFMGSMANQPYEGGRKTSDITCIVDVG